MSLNTLLISLTNHQSGNFSKSVQVGRSSGWIERHLLTS